MAGEHWISPVFIWNELFWWVCTINETGKFQVVFKSTEEMDARDYLKGVNDDLSS